MSKNDENIVINKANELLMASSWPHHITISSIAKALHMKQSVVKTILDSNGYAIHKHGPEKEFDYITKK